MPVQETQETGIRKAIRLEMVTEREAVMEETRAAVETAMELAEKTERVLEQEMGMEAVEMAGAETELAMEAVGIREVLSG